MILGIVAAVVVVLLLLYVIATYNGLVRLRNRIDNAWAQIDVQLKRRYDLIPNLVNTVKGYAAHEKGTFEAVTAARAGAINATGVGEQAQAENMITGALKSLFAVAEAYPDLKANQNFLELQEELSGTEGRIAYARQFYNDSVLKLNTKIQRRHVPGACLRPVLRAPPPSARPSRGADQAVRANRGQQTTLGAARGRLRLPDAPGGGRRRPPARPGRDLPRRCRRVHGGGLGRRLLEVRCHRPGHEPRPARLARGLPAAA